MLIVGQGEYVCFDVDMHKRGEYGEGGWEGACEEDEFGGVEAWGAGYEDGVESERLSIGCEGWVAVVVVPCILVGFV